MAESNGEPLSQGLRVVLPPELEAFVREQVATQRFASADDLIAEALFWFRDQCDLQRVKHERLKADVRVGVEQADRGELTDGPAVLARLRGKLGAAEEQPK